MNKRYAAFILLMTSLLFSPFSPGNSRAETEEEMLRTRSSTYNGIRSFCGKTIVYYAQNTPEWDKIGLGEGNTVGGAMCAATALSNVVVNCVPYWELYRIEEITLTPVRIDTHNIAPGFGSAVRNKFVIKEPCDFFRFFPLCIGNYSTGNNRTGSSDTRNTGYYRKILDAYGLDYMTVRDTDLCIECIEEGAFVIACTGGETSPIAPKSGHFFVLAGVKNGYLYCIDSYCREFYPYDKKHLIEIVEPGIIRIPVDEINYLCLTGTMFIIWPDKNDEYTQTDYNRIILETRTKQNVVIRMRSQ